MQIPRSSHEFRLTVPSKRPPSTGMIAPVIQFAAAETRNRHHSGHVFGLARPAERILAAALGKHASIGGAAHASG
jgi:hypothetical protein